MAKWKATVRCSGYMPPDGGHHDFVFEAVVEAPDREGANERAFRRGEYHFHEDYGHSGPPQIEVLTLDEVK